jgi:hypothetical protein
MVAQSVGGYKLIGLDQTESAIVRRALHQWSRADQQAITPFVLNLQQKQEEHGLSNLQMTEPRWETNVYPLWYWAYAECDCKVGKVGSETACLDYLLGLPSKLFPGASVSLPQEGLREPLASAVQSEIDILVEDVDYFIFVEAKIVPEGWKARFERNKYGVHQLVNQYVQGRILEKLADKTFALATVGANNGLAIQLSLNPMEQALMHLVNDERQSLEIIDLDRGLLRQP